MFLSIPLDFKTNVFGKNCMLYLNKYGVVMWFGLIDAEVEKW
jgi:hypothetical protein